MIIPEEMRRIDFLQKLGEQYLNQIAMMAQLKEYEAGSVLFPQGEDSQQIYFVLSGKVGLSVNEPDGSSVEVAQLGPGEILGWSPVLGRHSMTATARAVTRCRVASLDVKEIDDLCARDPRFGCAFLREIAVVVSDRLWATRRSLARRLSHRDVMTSALEGSD
jgi:CRP-like cAMP-binding protein